MIGLRILEDPGPCSYLPGRVARLEHEFVRELSPAQYAKKMDEGFRRFGHDLFRPRCPSCNACQALRIDVARFRPDRSQRRCLKRNRDDVRREIVTPEVTDATLDLSQRFHDARALTKGWSSHDRDPFIHRLSFVENPFAASEWRYFLGDELIGVGYVDDLPTGLSAVYFLHEPGLSERSLGTYNVLSMIDEARLRRLPHVYLGYYVDGCQSLEYKARFRPNEILTDDGRWRPFRDG